MAAGNPRLAEHAAKGAAASAAARRADQICKLVASAPPLKQAQVDKIVRLLHQHQTSTT